MMWVYFIFCNFIYGTSIAIKEERPFNWSIVLATILFAGLFLSVLWHPPGDDHLPPEDGSLGTRLLLWLDGRVRRAKGV